MIGSGKKKKSTVSRYAGQGSKPIETNSKGDTLRDMYEKAKGRH